MNRTCPQCNNHSMQVKMLSFSNPMQCSNCYHQFKYTTLGKSVLGIIGSLIPLATIIIGLETKNWGMACLVLFAVPVIGELTFAKYCKLKPLGIKSLKNRIHEKVYNKQCNEMEGSDEPPIR